MSSLIFRHVFATKEITSFLHRDTNFIQVCGYAARKGTREKMRKKKIKVEIKKVGFIPHNLREKARAKGPLISKRIDDTFKRLPTDNVFVGKFFQWKVYDFHEAVDCHRESHHPQQYNKPNAHLHAFIELDMTGPKKTKFVEPWNGMAKIPHHFDHGENRSILVFCKTPELRADAENAGATLVGDVDIIKKIEKGDIMLPDFEFVLGHPNILPELVCLRGLLKKKFPNAKIGTLGLNIEHMVTKFRTGVRYSALRDEAEQSYGWVDAVIGTLDMEKDHLEKNFTAVLNDVLSMAPKRPGPFVTRVLLRSPPSNERFKLNLSQYIQTEEEDLDSDSDDEEVAVKA